MRTFSREYVYGLEHLAQKRDRAFRKACTRAEAALAKQGLNVRVEADADICEDTIRRCTHCRAAWMAKRRQAAVSHHRRHDHGAPSWAGAPTEASAYLAALAAHHTRKLTSGGAASTPTIALFVISGSTAPPNQGDERPITGYVLTERVGRTIVAVDGVHDYSLDDPRADPSALLLHVAAEWWQRTASALPPLWLNDGPVPTPGLLKYKSQYHGELLDVLSVSPHWRVAARAKWAGALAALRARHKRHIGARAIRRAAARIYVEAIPPSKVRKVALPPSHTGPNASQRLKTTVSRSHRRHRHRHRHFRSPTALATSFAVATTRGANAISSRRRPYHVLGL